VPISVESVTLLVITGVMSALLLLYTVPWSVSKSLTGQMPTKREMKHGRLRMYEGLNMIRV
jgi:hypothetical protein